MQTQNIELARVNLDALRTNLKDNNITFGNRSGPQKLVSLAVENNIDVPMLDEKPSRNVIPKKYRDRYGKEQSCGDEVASVLKEAVTVTVPQGDGKKPKTAICVKELEKVAKANKIDFERWAHMNPGMQRMNLGNVLRARVVRGEKVVIGTRVWDEVTAEPEDDERAQKM